MNEGAKHTPEETAFTSLTGQVDDQTIKVGASFDNDRVLIFTPNQKQEATKEIDQETLYNMGKLMAKDLPDDCPSLIGSFGVNCLLYLSDHRGSISQNEKEYEAFRAKFIDYHIEFYSETKPHYVENITQLEVYEGYLHSMAEEGFINIDRNLNLGVKLRLALTEQGKLEANFIRLQLEYNNRDGSELDKETDLADLKDEGKAAGVDRFKFWQERVKQGKILTLDEKNRIDLGTILFDDD